MISLYEMLKAIKTGYSTDAVTLLMAKKIKGGKSPDYTLLYTKENEKFITADGDEFELRRS